MGNRAVIAINKADPKSIGLYLHWHGSPESIQDFLNKTIEKMGDRLGDACYGAARLTQVIGESIEGNLSFGMDLQENLDCDNYDNGLYVVDTTTMKIIERLYTTVI